MNKVKAHVTSMPVTAGAAKASTTKITEELLVCRLCSLKYRADGRRPMALRCVHTFCEVCLERLLCDQADDGDPSKNQKQRRSRRQQLACPTCQTVTPLGKSCTASSLPVNPSIMELLGIFDRPVPGVHSNGIAPGFSQVKITTATTSHTQRPTSNGLDSQERASPVAALMKNKKERRRGDHPTSDLSCGDGKPDDTGGGTVNQVNWVSTVNISSSVPQQQQQQSQQQQYSSSFSAAKPAAMPSAVTSVSTMKKQPQQTSPAPSPEVVSSPDANACGSASSTSPRRAAHMCCRCGQRPAAVSVASSSQTMAPQKLCSDCWNGPAAARRNGEDQKREAAASADTEQGVRLTSSTKQPESFSVVASKVSTVKADLRSGVSASEARPNEAANARPQTEREDSTSAESRASLRRDRQGTGFVADRTSTIEVRRRSYMDNRARAPPPTTSAPDAERCSTTDASGTAGAKVDQLVQSTNVQAPGVSTSSKPRPRSDVSVQQRSSPDTQPTAVPEPISEVISASFGSNASIDRNPGHQFNTIELTHSLSHSTSAPSIEDIHPMPCSNPPYNPDFHEDSQAAWRISDEPVRLNLNPSENGNHEQHSRQQQQQPRNISATTNKGVALSFLLANSRQQYLPEQPPKYEDIIHEKEAVAATAPEAPPAASWTQQAALPTPTDPLPATASAAPGAMRLVRSFGKYGEITTQPGVFRAPRQVSVSPAEKSTRVVVGDAANGTVQVFGESGECLSMLRADTVKGCCLLDDCGRMLLATGRGVEVSVVHSCFYD